MSHPIERNTITSAATAATNPADQAELVNRARAGDDQAYAQLVTQHKDRVYATVYRLLHNHEDAAEICQDAFVKSYFALDSFRGDAAYATWVIGIALNLARNRIRDRGRKGRDKAVSLEQLQENSVNPATSAHAPNPGQHALAQETVANLEHCLEQLDDGHREVFALRMQDEMTYQDIATACEVPVGTVKSRLNAARRALRDCLERKGVL